MLLLEDGLLANSGLAVGDVILRINNTPFDFEALNTQAQAYLIETERERLVSRDISRNAILTLVASIRATLDRNELVANADIVRLSALISEYPNHDAIISGIRSYTVTDAELAQLSAQIEREVDANVPPLDEIADGFVITRDALETAKQTILKESIVAYFSNTSASVITFEVERAGELLTIEVPAPSNTQFELAIPIAVNDAVLGLDLRIARFPELVLQVAERSVANRGGLSNGDVLVSINGTPYTAKQLMIDNDLTLALTEQELGEALQAELVGLVQGTFAQASDAPVVIEVLRDGEVVSHQISPSDEGEALGLRVFPAELPYFQIIPEQGGPAAVDIGRGSALTQVDNTFILPEMDTSFVQTLADDDGIALSDEDFRINVSYKQLNARGGFEEATGRRVNKQVPPELLMAFLYNFGIFVPLTAIVLGLFIARNGMRLLALDMIAARWTGVILLWLIVGILVAGVREFYVSGVGGSLRAVGGQPFQLGEAIRAVLPLFIISIPLSLALWRLGLVIEHIFDGEESLTSRNTRFAWSLLIPTLAALVLVAARPLEQTFISSLTDERLASTQPARFVGFDNYEQLLSVQFDVVECKTPTPEQLRSDPITRSEANFIRLLEGLRFSDTLPEDVRNDASDRIQLIAGNPNTLSPDECLKTGNGATDWQLSEELVAQGYREATVLSLPFSQRGLRILGKDAIFLKGIFNTLQFTTISVTLELILGMIIALVVNTKFSARGIMRTAMLVPWAIPTVVGATLWGVIMRDNQSGILNVFFSDLGVQDGNEAWLSTTGPWLSAVIAIDVWKTAPFMALLLLAGLQTISGDIYEAASVDGASKIRQFFSITLPLLRPTIAVALVFRTLDALRVFDLFQVLLDPTSRPSMATHNYNQLIAQQQGGYASAIGVVIFGFILIFTIIYVRFVGIEQEG